MRLEALRTLGPADVAEVTELVRAATEDDGVSPISEHVALHLRYGGEGLEYNLMLRDGDALVGYAHLDPTDEVAGAAVEVVVHPAARRRGHGRALVEAADVIVAGGRLRLWAHGDHPAARALAATLGYRVVRELWQMRRSLWSPLPATTLPRGVRLRSFRPGEDDEPWLALNARAFAGHPEQGVWTAHDLHARMRESWFDPEGFLIAQRGDGEMIAFHWMKIHGGHGGDHGHEPIGEVYVVGVDPRHRGQGIGRAITVAGLRRMRALGLTQAMLYVEADNVPAVKVYEGLGFSHWDTDVMFSRRTPQPSPPPSVE